MMRWRKHLRFGAIGTGALALVLIAWVGLTQPAQPAESTQPTIEQIAAQALEVPVADVHVLRVDQKAGGREAIARLAVAAEGETETVWVRYMTADGSLLRITWLGRSPDAADAIAVSEQEAQASAEQLVSRLFPEVPVTMALTEARLHDQTPQYSFGWVGALGDDVFSGDQVLVRVSAVTGAPISYLQRVAHVRPDPDEIPITRERAVELAAQASERTWREQFGRDVSVDTTSARLVLSSVISHDLGPVWLVAHEVKDADAGSRLELTERAIDAMTGVVLQ